MFRQNDPVLYHGIPMRYRNKSILDGKCILRLDNPSASDILKLKQESYESRYNEANKVLLAWVNIDDVSRAAYTNKQASTLLRRN